jgi:hypothetical protein
MRRERLIITAILTVLTVSAFVPAAANAGPLLSGYGGPGQGNQAILGSGLVGGHGGGGSGSHGSSAGNTSTGEGSAGGVGSSAVTGASGANAGPGTSTANATKLKPTTRTGSATGDRSPVATRALAPAASAGGGGTLGLSGADALYILLGLGALVLTGALTRMLARQPG